MDSFLLTPSLEWTAPGNAPLFHTVHLRHTMSAEVPVISVIVPCFNQAHLLREALDSVGTPRRGTEIVVVDDGSTDDTLAVANDYAVRSPVPVFVVRQDHQGCAAARNRGLRESRGQYLVFLDADDRLAPGALDLAATAIEERPECFFVFGRSRMVSPDGAFPPAPVQPRSDDHYRELLRRNFIWISAMVLFRREAVELARVRPSRQLIG